MLPIFDPVGAALSIILGGVDAVVAITDPDLARRSSSASRPTRATTTSSRSIAAENGWDMLVEHDGAARRPHAALHVVARPSRARRHAALRPLAASTSRRASRRSGRSSSVSGFVWIAGDQDDVRRHPRLGLGPHERSPVDLSRRRADRHAGRRLPGRGAADAGVDPAQARRRS